MLAPVNDNLARLCRFDFDLSRMIATHLLPPIQSGAAVAIGTSVPTGFGTTPSAFAVFERDRLQ